MGKPIIEQILARSAGVSSIEIGEIVVSKVDRAVWLDLPFFPVMSRTVRRTLRRTVLVDA